MTLKLHNSIPKDPYTKQLCIWKMDNLHKKTEVPLHPIIFQQVFYLYNLAS